jgi:hypothetical protein
MDQLLPRESLAGLSYVTELQLEYAKRLLYATDRSLALSRLAAAATFSGQLDLAERALNDAMTAAQELEPGMVRDQRITSIVQSLMGLAEARLRDSSNPLPLGAEPPANPEPPARTEPTPPPPPAPGAAPPPAAAPATTPPAVVAPLPASERPDVIRKAAADWKHAGILAEQIVNPTYHSELLYRVADSMATGSQNIINTFPKLEGGTVTSAEGVNRSYGGLPDQLLQDATTLVLKIKRPVWRDRGLVAVGSAAAESKQFARAIETVRKIPQPEVRTDGLLKIADLQARKGDENGATVTYREAATAVASIPLDDPRAVLAGVLIDDLIAVGRFEDARRSVPLYPDEARRLIALGAIAEAQGRRGAGASALKWIREEMSPEYQSLLYRKVNNGLVSAIESNRSRELSSGGRER